MCSYDSSFSPTFSFNHSVLSLLLPTHPSILPPSSTTVPDPALLILPFAFSLPALLPPKHGVSRVSEKVRPWVSCVLFVQATKVFAAPLWRSCVKSFSVIELRWSVSREPALSVCQSARSSVCFCLSASHFFCLFLLFSLALSLIFSIISVKAVSLFFCPCHYFHFFVCVLMFHPSLSVIIL